MAYKIGSFNEMKKSTTRAISSLIDIKRRSSADHSLDAADQITMTTMMDETMGLTCDPSAGLYVYVNARGDRVSSSSSLRNP